MFEIKINKTIFINDINMKTYIRESPGCCGIYYLKDFSAEFYKIVKSENFQLFLDCLFDTLNDYVDYCDDGYNFKVLVIELKEKFIKNLPKHSHTVVDNCLFIERDDCMEYENYDDDY